MTEVPKSSESFSARLTGRVKEIKDQAVQAWNNTGSRDAVETFFGGEILAVAGIGFAVLGRVSNLLPIEAMGDLFAFGGVTASAASLAKLWEIELRQAFSK